MTSGSEVFAGYLQSMHSTVAVRRLLGVRSPGSPIRYPAMQPLNQPIVTGRETNSGPSGSRNKRRDRPLNLPLRQPV